MAGLIDILADKLLQGARTGPPGVKQVLGAATGVNKFQENQRAQLGKVLSTINQTDFPPQRRQALLDNLKTDLLGARQEQFGFEAAGGAQPTPSIQQVQQQTQRPQAFLGSQSPSLSSQNIQADPDFSQFQGEQISQGDIQLDRRGAVVNAQQTLGLSNAESQLFNSESGFRPGIKNPTSSAFGIGQMIRSQREFWGKFLGINPNTVDPKEQITLARAYIDNRYGTPERALSFKQATVRRDASVAPSDLRGQAQHWIDRGFKGY